MTVKPNNSMNGFITNVQYPIYRESSTKIYLPRYYGIEKFGETDKNILSKGESIELDFQGNLFDYQTNIIQHLG